MDDIVRQALAKWPNVPHCHGWLGLDARGQWWMRDDRTQALGPFPSARGSLLRHDKLIDFIHRNYEPDTDGCWYFQNGPQRVYVELEATPVIWRVADDLSLTSHHGQPGQMGNPAGVLMDEQGRVYIDARMRHGDIVRQTLGLVHTQDVRTVGEAVEQGLWAVTSVQAAALPGQHHYVLSPAAANKKPA